MGLYTTFRLSALTTPFYSVSFFGWPRYFLDLALVPFIFIVFIKALFTIMTDVTATATTVQRHAASCDFVFTIVTAI